MVKKCIWLITLVPLFAFQTLAASAFERSGFLPNLGEWNGWNAPWNGCGFFRLQLLDWLICHPWAG